MVTQMGSFRDVFFIGVLFRMSIGSFQEAEFDVVLGEEAGDEILEVAIVFGLLFVEKLWCLRPGGALSVQAVGLDLFLGCWHGWSGTLLISF
mgnify:CR=1 FL=1